MPIGERFSVEEVTEFLTDLSLEVARSPILVVIALGFGQAGRHDRPECAVVPSNQDRPGIAEAIGYRGQRLRPPLGIRRGVINCLNGRKQGLVV